LFWLLPTPHPTLQVSNGPYLNNIIFTGCEPGDVMHSGISDALLEDVIVSTGAKEIKIKVPTSSYYFK